ncbi:Hint domain-containing protein [Microvirga thermotolerans]|uniref:Hint domain-containing protein n=1 Tax=Microvirga thermotolerans TaxID=2651334 RepID=A0A5P9JX54_9HYPH|nr:Hint domain-containing protein [Microvirga thermotolerans]QFU17013.1 hypothetical protein GDR74_12720 [Microvirga thermotolerans]
MDKKEQNNWSVEYSNRPVAGLGAHGIISVRNADGDIIRSYEGLSYGEDGQFKTMGTLVSDNIKARITEGISINYDPSSPSEVLFSGPREEIMSMMDAADMAVNEINKVDIDYPPFGVVSTPRSIGRSNSNAVIETISVAMGVKPPLSNTLPIPGQGVLLLKEEKLLEIRAATWDKTGSTLETHCFLADTPILMADGSEKPIQDIRPGDMVMAFDPKANNGLGDRQPARVRRTFQNVTKTIIDLRGLRMTPGHVVLSDNGSG